MRAKHLLILFLALFLISLSGCPKPFFTVGPGCGDLECTVDEDAFNCPKDCGGCADSDGVNFYFTGATTDNRGTSISDSCTNGTLTEGFCDNNIAYAANTTCASGCADASTCAGTGSELVAYCAYIDPATPSDPSKNFIFEVGYYACDPASGNAYVCDASGKFALAQDCAAAGSPCINGYCRMPPVVTILQGAEAAGAYFIVPATGSINTPIALNGTCSTAEAGASILTCAWSAGIGCSIASQSATGIGTQSVTSNATIMCTNTGTYTATLTATDDIGLAASESTDVIVSDPSLVLYYPFNDSAAPVPDESGNGNTGTVNGAAFGSDSGLNGSGAYTFSAADQYISAADSTTLRIPSSWTVSAWVKLDALPDSNKVMVLAAKGDWSEVIGLNHNYFLAVENYPTWGTGIAFTAYAENTTGADYKARWVTTPTTGTWYHVVGVYDDTENMIKLYVNGMFKVSASASITALATGAPCVTIGARFACNGAVPSDAGFGTIDNARIYKRALAADEVAELYGRESCTTPIECFSNSDCGTTATCQNAGVCGSAQCVSCTPACSSDADCASGETCLRAGTCDATCTAPGASEVFFYDFSSDFTGGTVGDVSGNGNNGTPSASGLAYTPSGKLGFGAQFNGAAGYIAPPTVPALTDAFIEKTIAMWIKADTTTVLQELYDEGTSSSGIALSLNSNNTIQLALRKTSSIQLVKNFAFSDTVNWHHLAAVFDNGALQLYMDGVLMAVGTATFTSVDVHAVAPAIGRADGTAAGGCSATGCYFKGRMDEVRVFNRALSEREVKELVYNCPVACAVNADCDDADALTLDTCGNPNTCAASCSHTQCASICSSSLDCPAGQDCFKPNTCEASCAVSDPSLMLFYTFATSETPVADLSGNSNTGTVMTVNAIHNATGGLNSGGAYNFSSVAYINAGDKATLDIDKNDFTILVWFKGPADATAKIPLVSKRPTGANGAVNGYMTEVLADGDVPYLQIDNSNGIYTTVTGTTDVSDGAWHNLVFAADRDGNGYIYVDGVLDKTGTIRAAGGSLSNTQPFWVRRDILGYGAASETVTLDNIMVYNRALSAAAVEWLFNDGSCAVACRSAADCDDANNLTIDTCNIPDSCTANCSYCGIECYSDADCSGGKLCAYAGICGKTACVAGDPALRLWYPFNYDDTPIYDMSKSGNNGTVYDSAPKAVWVADGRETGNGAYSFDGTNDRIWSNTLNFPSAMTATAWVNIAGDGGTANPNLILGTQYGNAGYRVTYDKTADKFKGDVWCNYSDGGGGFFGGLMTAVSATTPEFGTWYHVALTFDGADSNRSESIKLYVNGVLDGMSGCTPNTIYPGSGFKVGAYDSSSGYDFKGMVDDVRVYNRALSADEIAALVTGCPTPIACHADVDCGALSRCQNAGICGQATCVACTATCSTDADCAAGRKCINSGYCNSYCTASDSSNVLLYDFATSATPTPDLSGHGNDGTVSGSTHMPLQGLHGGGAYSFDGLNDYITAQHSPSLSLLDSEFAVTAWVKPDDTSTDGTYGDSIINQLGDYAGYDITWLSSGSFRVISGDGTIYYNRSVSAQSGVWSFVVLSGNTLYINGKGAASGVGPSAWLQNPSRPLMIGAWCSDPASCTPTRQFKGQIGEVRIYNRAISSGEILALSKQGFCETSIECLSNADCGEFETCQNAGICGSAACVPYTPLCTSNADCGAGETCLGANTSGACCSACATDADCDDGVPATIDICVNQNSCSASCAQAECATPVTNPCCLSESECVDSDPNTMNTCDRTDNWMGSCEFRTEDGMGGPYPPTIVSNGSGYGVFQTYSTGSLNYVRFSSAGSRIGGRGIVSGAAAYQGAVWNGERQEYAIVATVNGVFSFIRIGMDGVLKAPVTQLGQLLSCSPNCGGETPAIVLRPGNQADPNDDRYGIVWAKSYPSGYSGGAAYFTEVDATGNPIPVMNYKYVCGTLSTYVYPAVLWAGSAYKVFCVDNPPGGVAVKATTIMPDGTTSSEIISGPDSWNKGPMGAAPSSSGGHAVSWRSGDSCSVNYPCIFAKTDSSDIVLVSNAAAQFGGRVTSVAFGNSEYGIAWSDQRNEPLKYDYDPIMLNCPITVPCNDIYFARFSASGIRLSDDMKINNSITLNQGSPAVAYDASSGRYAVAWTQYTVSGTPSIHFKLVPDCTVACDSDADCSPGVCVNPATCSAACQ